MLSSPLPVCTLHDPNKSADVGYLGSLCGVAGTPRRANSETAITETRLQATLKTLPLRSTEVKMSSSPARKQRTQSPSFPPNLSSEATHLYQGCLHHCLPHFRKQEVEFLVSFPVLWCSSLTTGSDLKMKEKEK